jgi:hypothetical protein
MRTGGQTDITKLTVAFRNFANAPENKFGISIGEARIMLSIPYTQFFIWCVLQRQMFEF